MIRRRSYKQFALLLCLVALLLLLPFSCTQVARRWCIKLFSPLWLRLTPTCFDTEKERLEAENHLLRLELIRCYQATEELKWHQNKAIAVPAHVIYRDPNQWMSLCWVNVGESTNQEIGHKVIEHNSPVLVGRALVGVVEKVYEHQSSIRLITDPALKPSVRVVRGHLQNIFFQEQLKSILARLETKAPQAVIEYLKHTHDELNASDTNWFLAKGTLQGAAAPIWRGRGHLLKGIGFNCDFADPYCPARELKTGKAQADPKAAIMPIIQERDLLVTTGMDGVFPMGLPVAEVTKIYPLREGAYAYEIEAEPVVKCLDALHTVCIIPKVKFTPP